MHKAKKLKNGMRLHLVPFAGTETMTLFVLVKIGSRYEELKTHGAAHFVEHMMFKGTKRRPHTLEITRVLDRYGAYYNAFTDRTMTGYFIKIDAKHAAVAVDLLCDMLFNSKFDDTEFNRERQVIIEEDKMYFENPIMYLEDILEEAMFGDNPLGRKIGGSIKSITQMKRQDLIDMHRQYYVPSEMIIVAAGRVAKDLPSLLNKTFGQIKKAPVPASFATIDQMPERELPRVKRQYKDLKQIQIGLGFPIPGFSDDKIPAIDLLANILGGNMSSRLFIELRERRGLCYRVHALISPYNEVGAFMIRAGLDIKRLDLAMKTLFAELHKIKKYGVTKKELDFAKDNLEGSDKLQFEDSHLRADFYAQQELYLGQVETPAEKFKKYRNVHLDDIKKIANEILNNRRLSIAAIGPYKTDESLLKHFPVLV